MSNTMAKQIPHQKLLNTDPDMNLPKGNAGETHQQADNQSDKMTTQQGIVISDNQNSLSAGRRGPTLLEDFI